MGKLTRMVGEHRIAVTPVIEGRKAGRFAIAYQFFGKWQFITDEDTGDLRTWKTEEEALVIAEAWRLSWDNLKLPR